LDNPSSEKTDSLLRELYSSWCDTCDNSLAHSENNITLCWTSGESTLEYDILDDLYIFSAPENTLKISVLSDNISRTFTNFLKKILTKGSDTKYKPTTFIDILPLALKTLRYSNQNSKDEPPCPYICCNCATMHTSLALRTLLDINGNG
jgi:hypothetical protein